MKRLTEAHGVVSLFEPADLEAGLDSDSFNISKMDAVDIVLIFGAITGDAVLTVYSGATVGAKTTAEAFRYKVSTGVYKAPSCDLFGAESTEPDGLTLAEATFKNRMVVIHLDAVEITDGQPWITVELGGQASALMVAGIAVPRAPRYQPPGTLTA